jgi:hypothetical protein
MTAKSKIRKIIDQLEVDEFTLQVRINDIMRLADITQGQLLDVIKWHDMSYGLYSIAQLKRDVGIKTDRIAVPSHIVHSLAKKHD